MSRMGSSDPSIFTTFLWLLWSFTYARVVKFGRIPIMGLELWGFKFRGVCFAQKFLVPSGGETIHRMRTNFGCVRMVWTFITEPSLVGLGVFTPPGVKNFHVFNLFEISCCA